MPHLNTMTEYYPIYEVNPDWMIDPESMGSKQKFWYRDPANHSGSAWLFKYPRPNSGEHWAEKIAAEIAQVLDIPHARVELAVCRGYQGTIAESFVTPQQTLVHGNELLTLAVSDYNPDQRRRPSQHNIDNIFRILKHLCTGMGPGFSDKLKTQFANYLILDALIGNTDRHHENWGVLLDVDEDTLLGLAPSFDHASSLGIELSAERRNRRLAEGTVGNYAARGQGGIYWSEYDSRRPSPLELALLATVSYPAVFVPVLEKLAILAESNILGVLNRIPEEWMTDSEMDFAFATMRHSVEKLRG